MNSGNFLTSWATIIFSPKILLRVRQIGFNTCPNGDGSDVWTSAWTPAVPSTCDQTEQSLVKHFSTIDHRRFRKWAKPYRSWRRQSQTVAVVGIPRLATWPHQWHKRVIPSDSPRHEPNFQQKILFFWIWSPHHGDYECGFLGCRAM